MFGQPEMHYPASTMGQNHQNEQNSKSGGRHRKEIDGNQLVQMVVQERLPDLRRRSTLSGEKSQHGSFRDGDTPLEQLPVDTGRSPEWVGNGHLQEQSSDRGAGFWTATFSTRNPAPEQAKALAMPGRDGLRPDDNQRSVPILPTPGQPHPKETIRPSQPRPRALALEHSQFLAKGKVLQGDISEASGRNEETKQGTKQREHGV
jgi:hypothetical protein